MNRSGKVTAAAFVGAIAGAAAFIPVANSVLDGGPDCTACGSYTTALIGMTFKNPYPAWLALVGAAVGAIVLGLAAFLISRASGRGSGERNLT